MSGWACGRGGRRCGPEVFGVGLRFAPDAKPQRGVQPSEMPRCAVPDTHRRAGPTGRRPRRTRRRAPYAAHRTSGPREGEPGRHDGTQPLCGRRRGQAVMFPPGVGSAPFPFWFPQRSPMCVARWRRPAGAARTSPRRRSGTVTDDTRRSRRLRTMRRIVRRPERQNADGDVRGSPRKPNARVVAVDGNEIQRCELRSGVVRYR